MYQQYNPRCTNGLLLLYNKYFGCLLRNVKVLFIYFAENFIFNGQSLKSSDFLWKLSFSSIFWWWMYDLVTRLAALIYKARKSYFLEFHVKIPCPQSRGFLLGEWMKVALTGHIPSEYFQTHSSLSVDLMCTVPPAPQQWHIHTNPRSSQFLNQMGVKHLSERASRSVIFTANTIKPVNDDDENASDTHQQFNFKTVFERIIWLNHDCTL